LPANLLHFANEIIKPYGFVKIQTCVRSVKKLVAYVLEIKRTWRGD